MRLTEEELLDALARMPFADTLELAVILGEALRAGGREEPLYAERSWRADTR